MRGAQTLALLNDFHRQRIVGIARIDQVIPAIHPLDVHGVGVIPVTRPVVGPWIEHLHPIAVIPESRVPFDSLERQSVDAEAMTFSEVRAEAIVGDAVTVVSTALRPGAVLGLPVLRPVLLPRRLLRGVIDRPRRRAVRSRLPMRRWLPVLRGRMLLRVCGGCRMLRSLRLRIVCRCMLRVGLLGVLRGRTLGVRLLRVLRGRMLGMLWLLMLLRRRVWLRMWLRRMCLRLWMRLLLMSRRRWFGMRRFLLLRRLGMVVTLLLAGVGGNGDSHHQGQNDGRGNSGCFQKYLLNQRFRPVLVPAQTNCERRTL